MGSVWATLPPTQGLSHPDMCPQGIRPHALAPGSQSPCSPSRLERWRVKARGGSPEAGGEHTMELPLQRWSRPGPCQASARAGGRAGPRGADRGIPGRSQVTDTCLGRAWPLFTKDNRTWRPSAGRSISPGASGQTPRRAAAKEGGQAGDERPKEGPCPAGEAAGSRPRQVLAGQRHQGCVWASAGGRRPARRSEVLSINISIA